MVKQILLEYPRVLTEPARKKVRHLAPVRFRAAVIFFIKLVNPRIHGKGTETVKPEESYAIRNLRANALEG